MNFWARPGKPNSCFGQASSWLSQQPSHYLYLRSYLLTLMVAQTQGLYGHIVELGLLFSKSNCIKPYYKRSAKTNDS